MHRFHVIHLFAILASGAISLPLLASTTSAAAASPRTTSAIEAQLAGLEAPAVSQATLVASVSFVSSDRQGAMPANWTVDASTSLSGALAIGGTITISAPASTTFPSSSSAYKVNGTVVTAIPTTAAGTVTIATPVALGDSSEFSVVITGVTNPAAGSYANSSFSVSTIADSTAANPASGLSFGTVVSGVSFSLSSLLGAGSATWTVGFTTSTNGALATGDTITISAPAATTFPSSSSAYKVNGTTVTAIPTTAAGTVTIATPVALGDSTAVSVQIAGVTNPAASSYPTTSFSASTTADAAANPATGQSFSAGLANTTTALGLSSASVAYGSEASEIFTVTVTGLSGEGYPEGTVAVYSSSTELCSATLYAISSYGAGATCSLTAYELAGGAYDDVFATYIPGVPSSSNSSYTYGTSNSAVQTLSVASANTTTTLGLSSASVAYGSETSEIFTVTVTGLSGEGYPEGTVAVYNSSTELCSATLYSISSYSAGATCSLTARELTGGAYDDVFASYSPSTPSSSTSSYTYGTSSSTPAQAFSVGSASTTRTTVSASPTKVAYGDESASLFSVTVTADDGAAVPSGEKVTVHVGAIRCTTALKEGKGTCRVAKTALPAGSYPVSATYGGDANLRGSSGSSVSRLAVSKDTTRTSVSESPAKVSYGHESASRISVAVTTRYGEAVPNGETVTVHVGPVTWTAVLKGGNGTCTIANNALPVGSYPVQATYGGDANLSGSSVSALTVSKDTTRTRVSESPTSVTYGHESTSVFSVTVTTHYGEMVPNGEMVTVFVGPVTCTAVLTGGNGTCTIANNALPVGSYPVQATYGGDSNLSGSSGSSASNLTV